ncbi:MAG: class I SAM-dependent methyltransferase [Eubacteriaceae bacterium]|nr:class I SAM-dependent methyltransferase [Eubacteriaceae bacterium]
MAKWNLDFYQDEDGYSDGDIETEILELLKSGKQPNDILKEDDRWAMFYHLSPLRQNVLSWYPFNPESSLLEIGAGCGALTGLFCKKVKTVTAVELTKRRSAINFQRNQSCDNLELLTGNFNNIVFDKPFDMIVLNGVLEYAGSFTEGEDPYCSFLQKIRSLLAPQGVLLIAIENRLGLKYFNGVVEDHTSALFSGLNEYPGVDFVKTFSKSELQSLLEKSGYDHYRFYYPFPDYKFPDTILTDETINTMGYNYGNSISGYNHDRLVFFDENKMIDTLQHEKILDRFANSFIVEVGCNALPKAESDLKYVKYSNKRRNEFQISTIISSEEGKWRVEKKPLTEKAWPHLKKMIKSGLKTENQLFRHLTVVEKDQSITMPYLQLPTLEEMLKTYIDQGNQKQFDERLDQLLAFIGQNGEMIRYGDDPGFINVFGEDPFNAPALCKKNTNIDYILGNIFYDEADRHYWIIDYEWVFDFAVPVKFITWRSLFYFFIHNPEIEKFYDFKTFLMKGDISEEDHQAFLKWDYHFGQQYVAGDNQTSRYLKKTYNENGMLTDFLSDEPYEAELYGDDGTGFTEARKQILSDYVTQNTFEIKISLDALRKKWQVPIETLRFDPCAYPCTITDLKCTLDGKQFTGLESNGLYLGDGEWHFPEKDPQILFKNLKKTNHRIGIKGSLQKITPAQRIEGYHQQLQTARQVLGQSKDMAQKWQRRYAQTQRTLDEIKNSTVWKLSKPLRKGMDKLKKDHE